MVCESAGYNKKLPNCPNILKRSKRRNLEPNKENLLSNSSTVV
jgi:hypothetical protein